MKAVILMTRVPIPGQTKTRLMSVLSPDECADIHSCFLKDIYKVLGDLGEDISVFTSYTPVGKFHILEELLVGESFAQEGDSLGERMMNAFQRVMDMGYKEVVLIGSDIPEITTMDIMESFKVLGESDICIGPTLDGGYYLIGMKEIHKRLFTEEMKWGNKTVLEGTFRLIDELRLSVGLAPKKRDIDTGEDFEYLLKNLENMEALDMVPINTLDFLIGYREDREGDERRART